MGKVFTINPGSTSTKVALIVDGENVFSRNITHSAQALRAFATIGDQFDARMSGIMQELNQAGIDLQGCDAFVGRGGGLQSMPGGVYEVNAIMLEQSQHQYTVDHPARLGPRFAYEFAKQYGARAFVVNPPDVDEFCDLARLTGLKGVYRESRTHALNQKEIAIRYAKKCGRKYQDLNLIICHIGGGISVTAHEKGAMVDSNDIAQGDGPMAPTRCGQLPVKDVIEMCFSGRYTKKELLEKASKSGGLTDHLGTSDAREVTKMVESGNAYAKLVYDGMIYQIAKYAGAMAAVLCGKIDAVILTGGISHDAYLVSQLEKRLGFLAPIVQMPGEYEMEAMAAGAERVMSGEETAAVYTGSPVWKDFTDISGYYPE